MSILPIVKQESIKMKFPVRTETNGESPFKANRIKQVWLKLNIEQYLFWHNKAG